MSELFQRVAEAINTTVPREKEIVVTVKNETPYVETYRRQKTGPLPRLPNNSNVKDETPYVETYRRQKTGPLPRLPNNSNMERNDATNIRPKEDDVKTKEIDANKRTKEDDVVNTTINIPKEEDVHLSKSDSQSANRFTQSKNFIQTIADVSLMMANFSQLRAVLDFNERGQFYISLLTFIIISLLSHILFVIINVMRTNYNSRHLITVGRASKILGKKDEKDKEYKIDEKDKVDTIDQKDKVDTIDEKVIVHTIDETDNVHKKAVNKKKNDTDQKKKVRYFLCCTKTERLEEYIDNSLCQCTYCHTNRYLDYICRILVFITICANIGITGIGISE